MWYFLFHKDKGDGYFMNGGLGILRLIVFGILICVIALGARIL